MKVTRQEKHHASQQGRHETIVTAWRALGRTSAGAEELISIQQVLADKTISPAGIARVLAQEGVELLHPEVINCDARWRQAQLENRAKRFASVSRLQSGIPLKLTEAETAIAQLEKLRNRFVAARDETALDEVKSLGIDARQNAIKRAKDPSLATDVRAVQAEVAEWLRVWLETPNLFAPWLELRKASAAFSAKFPNG
jgi:hypothetical protein